MRGSRTPMNLAAGPGVAMSEFEMASGHGFTDYLLFVSGKAVGVLEAKPAGYALANGELQADKSATHRCRRVVRRQPTLVNLP